MPCCWKASSLKACPWKRRLNCNPHLMHLSPVSGSIFLWINAPSSAMLCSSAVSRIWPGNLTGRKWDSLTWLPSPSGPLLFPDLLHLLHLLDGLASSRGSSWCRVSPQSHLLVAPHHPSPHSPVCLVRPWCTPPPWGLRNGWERKAV